MSSFYIYFEEFLYFSSLIILVFGIPGNVMLLIMYSRKKLKRFSFSIYFQLIAIIDLFITLNWLKIFFRYQYNYYIEDTSLFMCKFVSYSIYCAGPISSWNLIAVSVDRLVTIMFPRRFVFLFKRAYQIAIISCIFVFNMVYYIHLLIDFRLVDVNTASINSTHQSKYVCVMNFDVLYWIDLVNASILPFIFMILSSSLTINFIVKSRTRTNTRTTTRTCRRILNRDIKFGLTSISLNILFLVLNMPNQIFGIYLSLSNDYEPVLWKDLLGFILLAMFYANHAFGFYLQLAINGIFRKEVTKVFCIRTTINSSNKVDILQNNQLIIEKNKKVTVTSQQTD